MNNDEQNFITNFEKIIGRRPNKESRERLLRMRDTLQLHDNDSLWLIIMSLESYFTRFLHIPKQHKKELKEFYDAESDLLKRQFETEQITLLNTLAEKVDTLCSEQHKQRTSLMRWKLWAIASTSILLLAVVCFTIGVMVGLHPEAFWMAPVGDTSPLLHVLHTIMRAPVGGVLLVMLLLSIIVAGTTYLYMQRKRRNGLSSS